MNYYICNYSDYSDLPNELFCGNTQGKERKSTDESKFITRCESNIAGQGCLAWMDGDEILLNKVQILSAINNGEWDDND